MYVCLGHELSEILLTSDIMTTTSLPIISVLVGLFISYHIFVLSMSFVYQLLLGTFTLSLRGKSLTILFCMMGTYCSCVLPILWYSLIAKIIDSVGVQATIFPIFVTGSGGDHFLMVFVHSVFCLGLTIAVSHLFYLLCVKCLNY